MTIFNLKTMCGALALAMLSSTSLAGIEFQPSKEVANSPLGTYGVGVATRVGLKSITPAGWRVMVHKDTTLPDNISWKMGDDWTSVLTQLSQTADLQITVDYTSKYVTIRPGELERKERESRQELIRKASTPLPLFSTTTTTETTVVAPAANTSSVTVATTTTVSLPTAQVESTTSTVVSEPSPKIALLRINPTPTMVEATSSLPAATYRPAASDDFSYQAPVALNKPSARVVAQAIANRFGLRLVWQAPESIGLKGPVTLFAQDAAQDVQLLSRALGYFSPIKLAVKGTDLVVSATNASTVYNAIGYQAPASVQIVNTTPVVSASTSTIVQTVEAPLAPVQVPVLVAGSGGTTHTEGADRKVAADQQEASKAAVPEVVTLTVPVETTVVALNDAKEKAVVATVPEMEMMVPKGAPLEDYIAMFLTKNGYTLEWKVEGGFSAKRDMTFKGQNIREVLAAVLPKLGLSADINTRDKHVVVRPGDPILDR